MRALDDEVHARVVTDAGPDPALAARRYALAIDPLLGPADLDRVVSRVMARVDGLGPLDPLLADPDVTEIVVNAGRMSGRTGRTPERNSPIRFGPGAAEHLVERIVAPLGLRADRTAPIVDAGCRTGHAVRRGRPACRRRHVRLHPAVRTVGLAADASPRLMWSSCWRRSSPPAPTSCVGPDELRARRRCRCAGA
jgi:hypothetical protein